MAASRSFSRVVHPSAKFAGGNLYSLGQRDLRGFYEEPQEKGSSIIFCSQYDTSKEHENLYDPALADAICDQIIYNAYMIQIEGESMRKRNGISE